MHSHFYVYNAFILFDGKRKQFVNIISRPSLFFLTTIIYRTTYFLRRVNLLWVNICVKKKIETRGFNWLVFLVISSVICFF